MTNRGPRSGGSALHASPCRLPFTVSLFTIPCSLITALFRISAGWGRLGRRKQGEPDREAVFFPRLAARAEWPEARRVAVAADEQPAERSSHPLVEPTG